MDRGFFYYRLNHNSRLVVASSKDEADIFSYEDVSRRTYTEVDGILYPNMGNDVREFTEAVDVGNADAGQYGHL